MSSFGAIKIGELWQLWYDRRYQLLVTHERRIIVALVSAAAIIGIFEWKELLN
jgi:hypothetical protein